MEGFFLLYHNSFLSKSIFEKWLYLKEVRMAAIIIYVGNYRKSNHPEGTSNII